jgi:CHAD domain-containing protein
MNAKQLNPSMPIGEFSIAILQKNWQKVLDLEEAVLKDKDSEPLHQMRVVMRRLRVAAGVFEGAIVLPKDASASSIGKIARTLGETRDLDVLQQSLSQNYQPLLQEIEKEKFAEILEYLRQKRARSFSDLQKMLDGNRYRKLKESLEKWFDRPDYGTKGYLAIQFFLPDSMLSSTCQLFLHSGWFIGATIESEEIKPIALENLTILQEQLKQFSKVFHSLRKQVKSTRYLTEFFAPFYENNLSDKVEELKQIQDLLGELQDSNVLHHFFESKMKVSLTTELPSIDKRLEQNKIEFWQNWQPFQQRYLSSEFRQSWRSIFMR